MHWSPAAPDTLRRAQIWAPYARLPALHPANAPHLTPARTATSFPPRSFRGGPQVFYDLLNQVATPGSALALQHGTYDMAADRRVWGRWDGRYARTCVSRAEPEIGLPDPRLRRNLRVGARWQQARTLRLLPRAFLGGTRALWINAVLDLDSGTLRAVSFLRRPTGHTNTFAGILCFRTCRTHALGIRRN